MTIKLSDINMYKLNKYKILTFQDLPQREVREVLSKDYKHNVNSIKIVLNYLKEYRENLKNYLSNIIKEGITLFMALSYETYYDSFRDWQEGLELEMEGARIKNIILTYVYYKELERLYQKLDFKLFIQIAQSNNDIELLKELDRQLNYRTSFKNNHLLKNYINNLIPKRIKTMIKRF